MRRVFSSFAPHLRGMREKYKRKGGHSLAVVDKLLGTTHVRGAPFIDPSLSLRRQKDQEIDRPLALLFVTSLIADRRESNIRGINSISPFARRPMGNLFAGILWDLEIERTPIINVVAVVNEDKEGKEKYR
jgi:hypothetical protein